MVTDESKTVYELKDGDIPCTPEKEPNYNYVYNFCGDVTAASFPKSVCSDIQMGSAIQYIDRSDGYKECNVIGHYDPERDDTFYSLIDSSDPSKGISITYQYGQKCPSGKLRSATINVVCANEVAEEDSANEPEECAYHVTMRSMYGCPKVRRPMQLFGLAILPSDLSWSWEYLQIEVCLGGNKEGLVLNGRLSFTFFTRNARSRRRGCATRTGTVPMTRRPRPRTATVTRYVVVQP